MQVINRIVFKTKITPMLFSAKTPTFMEIKNGTKGEGGGPREREREGGPRGGVGGGEGRQVRKMDGWMERARVESPRLALST